MIISDQLISDLLIQLKSSGNPTSRICFHANANSMQIMLIAISPGCVYDYFRNSFEGQIVFVGISGVVSLSTLSDNIYRTVPQHYSLSPGNVLVLDKTHYRRTVNNSSSPCVYLECIDGPYCNNDKVFLNT